VLGTLGGTLAHVSLNEEYIKQHAADASAAEAGDVLEGLGLGGRHLLRGAWQGVSGVVADPIEGWERDGLAGFLKGISKALLGAVVKPAVGLSDFTTKVSTVPHICSTFFLFLVLSLFVKAIVNLLSL
jgi:vacuolar protein sorting-associated protein 13A/C